MQYACFILVVCPSLLPVVENVYTALRELEQVSKVAMDTLECRVERLLQDMGSRGLLELPVDEPVSPNDFLQQSESMVGSAALTLCW